MRDTKKKHALPRFIWLAVAVCIAAAASLPASARTQRMLLLPGSYSIGGGGTSSASAMCLDGGGSTPRSGQTFSSAPTGVNSARVSVGGGPPIPLQQAIDSGQIAIEGNDGYSSIELKNLGTSSIKVSIPGASVIAPDRTYFTEDLAGLPQIGSKSVTFTQDELWIASSHQASRYLGIAANSKLVADTDTMVRAVGWAKSNKTRPVSEQALFISRALAGPNSPQYFLITESGVSGAYIGNEALGALATAAKAAWGSRGGTPKLVLSGVGGTSDFDAARLTIELADAGGGGQIPPTKSGVSFEPPGGFGNDFGVYDGKPWRDLQIVKEPKKNRLFASQDIFKRGKALLYAKTRPLIIKMVSVVRELLEYESYFKEDSDASVADEFASEVEGVVLAEFKKDPALRQQEAGIAELHIVMGTQTRKQIFSFDVDLETGDVRLASISTEQQ